MKKICLLGVIFLLNTWKLFSQAPQVCFSAPLSSECINVGDEPWGIASADFNGDGISDFAVTNHSSKNISVSLANGNGTYSTTNYTIGIYPRSITSSDFNNDGSADLAVAFGDSATILLGSGTGLFPTVYSYSVGVNTQPFSIIALDINNDGFVDIATANTGSDNVTVLLGSGNGTFGTIASYAVGDKPMAINSADFNGDGYNDLVTANDYSNGISILFNSGSGTFLPSVNDTIGSGTRSVITNDFNNDGSKDIVVPRHDSLVIFFGNGLGSFAPPIYHTTNIFNPQKIIQSDFNSDGKNDFVIMGVNVFGVFFGDGAGGFYSKTEYDLYSCMGIVSSDINGDGNSDLGITNSYDDKVVLLFGSGVGDFTSSIVNEIHNTPMDVISGDFNGDGLIDIATANDGTNDISVLIGIGAADFLPMANYTVGIYPRGITSSDFNNDSYSDLAVTNYSSNTVSVLLGSSSGALSSPISFPAGVNPSSITSSDFNNDGNPDLVAVNMPLTNMSVLLGSGSGSFGTPVTYTASATTYNSLLSADFNNDGNKDILRNGKMLLGTGLGTFLPQVNISGVNSFFTFGNFNSDNNLDLAYTCQGCTNVSVLLGIGSGSFATAVQYAIPSGSSDISSGDFTGDGIDDIVIVNRYNMDRRTSVLVGSASGVFSSALMYEGTYIPAAVTTNDFNQDGKTDIAIAQYDWHVSILLNNTPTANIIANNPICVGNSATLTATADGSTYNWSNGSTNNNIVVSPTLTTTYSVIGTTYAGCSTSAIKTITVNAFPLPTINVVANPTTVCEGSSSLLTASGANTYSWSSGVGTASAAVIPAVNTTYTVTGTDSNNCYDTQTVTVTVDNTCADVWPGDANSDGTADNLDVLELGLHYMQTGTSRAAISNSWQSYFANNWTGTISNGKNLNHSDCNGDGTINDDDTLAIYNNYGLVHTFKSTQTNTINPQITIVPDQPSVVKGMWGSASVYLGEATNPIININGLAYTIDFDNNLIESNNIYVEYENSFINSAFQNLNFRKMDFSNGKIHTATTHTVNNNVSGYGKIATIYYQISSALTSDQAFNISLSQANKSDIVGNIIPIIPGAATFTVLASSVGLMHEINNLLSITPNPTKGLLNINSKETIRKIEVISIAGEMLLIETLDEKIYQLHLQDFTEGIYFVKVFYANGMNTVKKIIVSR